MIYLAPLQGYTEAPFRLAWSAFFSGIDMAVSPFIPLSENLVFRSKHLRDVLPEKNGRMKTIPQVLGNETGRFIALAHRLAEMGYSEINWNLGCPKAQVARKKRGSGLLSHPDILRKLLDKLVPHLPIQLSIKTRLGYQSPDDFFALIKIYNDYPLACLMIHPRIGRQMYEGEMHLGILDQTIGQIRHRVVFSGDIVNIEGYENLKERYPVIGDWMLGRGVLTNPFLPEMLIKGSGHLTEEIIREKQYNFVDELFCELKVSFKHEGAILNKLKDYFSYFSRWFINEKEVFTHLSRLHTLDEFMPAAKNYLLNQQLAPLYERNGRPVA
jgi:tRNA-dihydrouridine synthase B